MYFAMYFILIMLPSKIYSSCLFISELLGTVDFVLSDETVVFRTCAKEKNKVVFQLVSQFISLSNPLDGFQASGNLLLLAD